MPLPKQRYSKDFGKKEKVLNYACQTYQLSRPKNVGAVMALIRDCQPKSLEDWEAYYFEHASTTTKEPSPITKKTLDELGERLYVKIREIVIPEWSQAFEQLTMQDCIEYIYNLTINRTYDGFLREKSVVEDHLAKRFPEIRFEPSDPELDHAGDIDYIGWIGEKTIGIQIKPVTAQANFGNYSPSERMKASFDEFTSRFGGKVFIIFSLEGEVGNLEVLEAIEKEVRRLTSE